MRLLFLLALGLFIHLTLATPEFPEESETEESETVVHNGVIGCDNKGDSFAVVLPTGLNGSMESTKLYHEFPVEFMAEKVSKLIGYVCMQHLDIIFSQQIGLPAAAEAAHGLKSGDTFIWEAGVSRLSLSSKRTGKVIATWTWILDDVKRIAALAKVDSDELEHILK